MERIDREKLIEMLRFVGEREATLETTPELLGEWLYSETHFRWPDGSPVAMFDSRPPDLVKPTSSVKLGMELFQFSPDGEPELFKDVIRFEMLQLSDSPNRTKVTGKHRDFLEVGQFFDQLWSRMLEEFTTLGRSTGRRQGVRTAKTEVRATVFRRLKDEHPEWSQAKVAEEAIKELNEFVSESTVRYVYRVMGWKWERANRIR